MLPGPTPHGPPTPKWASLEPGLLQHAFSNLSDEDRRPLLHVCTEWLAALTAQPHLLPAVTFTGPASLAARWARDFDPDYLGYRYVRAPPAVGVHPSALLLHEQGVNDRALARLAALRPPSRRWRLAGCKGQPGLVLALMSVLPANLVALEVATECSGPVLAAAARFPHLQLLTISGNGAGISWGGRGAAQVLPKLNHVRISLTHPIYEIEGRQGRFYFDCRPLSATSAAQLAADLAPAIGLTSLALVLESSDRVPALLAALPAVRKLSLQLRGYAEADIVLALQGLAPLTQLQGISLGVRDYWEGDELEPEEATDYNYRAVPPLVEAAAHVACLTELRIHGMFRLPPDWRELHSLHALVVDSYVEDQWGQAGHASLAPAVPLASLTRLEVHKREDSDLPGLELVASLPRLAVLRISDAAYCEAQQAQSRLRPGIKIEQWE